MPPPSRPSFLRPGGVAGGTSTASVAGGGGGGGVTRTAGAARPSSGPSPHVMLVALLVQAAVAFAVFFAWHEMSIAGTHVPTRVVALSRVSLFGARSPQRPTGQDKLLSTFRDAVQKSLAENSLLPPAEEHGASGVAAPPPALRPRVPPLSPSSAPARAVEAPPPSGLRRDVVASPSPSPAHSARKSQSPTPIARTPSSAPVAQSPHPHPPLPPIDAWRQRIPPDFSPPNTHDFRGRRIEEKEVFVTLVAGNSAARHAVVLLQSLVDVHSTRPLVILLSRGGIGSPECQTNFFKRKGAFRCDQNDTRAEEIVSPKYVEVFERLGARIVLSDEIARTPFTETIAGGRNNNWGMSLNKLQIFNMTQFDKIIFMDSDTIAFKNLDHLFGPEYPMFSAAMTYSCCNPMAPPTPSGGFWIVEPDVAWGIGLWDLMVEGKPEFNRNGTYKVVNGSIVRGEWYLSDLDLVRALFTFYDHSMYTEAVWPEMADLRHGYVPGIRGLPENEDMDDDGFAGFAWTRRGTPLTVEGFDPASPYWDGKTPVWRALNLSYDQCVGNCACLPGRDLKERFFSVHYSCIPELIHKPSWYETEFKLLDEMLNYAVSCTRYYYLEHYYERLVRAGARLDPPYWTGGPVPIWNTTHDAIVLKNIEVFRASGELRRW